MKTDVDINFILDAQFTKAFFHEGIKNYIDSDHGTAREHHTNKRVLIAIKLKCLLLL